MLQIRKKIIFVYHTTRILKPYDTHDRTIRRPQRLLVYVPLPRLVSVTVNEILTRTRNNKVIMVLVIIVLIVVLTFIVM